MNFKDCDYTDRDLLAFLGHQESQDIRWGDAYEEELVDRIKHGNVLRGSEFFLPKTHHLFRFRPGEVTIHAGMNGAYKSMVTGQMIMWLALNGEPGGVMSFEMPIVDTQERMLRQAAGTVSPSESFTREWSKWNARNIAYYDKLDSTASNRVLGAVMYMAKDLGCKHVLIDSLAKCGLPYGERGPEKEFIDALCATAKVFKIHIHLVCHVRKPTQTQGGDSWRPKKYDVRGAGELTDLVHNVVIHWNNKQKRKVQQKVSQGIKLTESDQKQLLNHDQLMIIEKQRNGAFEGAIGMEMHESLQFNEGRILPFDLPRGSDH